MTRHTYRPGDAIDPGATYYPMDGARQCDPLEPDDVIAVLDAWENAKPLSDAIDAARQALDGRCSCTTEECRCQPKADHWSPWLEWRGGPCPLSGGTPVEIECHDKNYGSATDKAGTWNWSLPDDWPGVIRRFRYRADNPAGWLPRGDWIPPAELWDEGCPVRVEWTPQYIPSDADRPASWDHVTHIRLVARQPQAGLPEAQPEPDPVPDLPEFVTVEDKAAVISLQCGREVVIGSYYTPDDLERIAEACRILAARERARRAGS